MPRNITLMYDKNARECESLTPLRCVAKLSAIIAQGVGLFLLGPRLGPSTIFANVGCWRKPAVRIGNSKFPFRNGSFIANYRRPPKFSEELLRAQSGRSKILSFASAATNSTESISRIAARKVAVGAIRSENRKAYARVADQAAVASKKVTRCWSGTNLTGVISSFARKVCSMKHCNAFVGFTLGIVVCASSALSGEAITGAALEELISGFEGTNGDFKMTFNSNGNVKMIDGNDVYEGTWNVTNDAVCTEIKALRNGAPTCRTVTDEGNNQFKMTRADNGKSLLLSKQ